MSKKKAKPAFEGKEFVDKSQHNLWTGMPLYHQEKEKEFAKITFRFDTEEDLKSFAKLIGQRLTSSTKYAYIPSRQLCAKNTKLRRTCRDVIK